MENNKIKPDILEVELKGPESLDVSIDKVYLGKGTDDRIPDAEVGDEGKVLTVTEAPDTFEWVEPEELVWESGEGLNSVQVKNINARAIGEGSVAEGPESDAHAYGSHTEGYMTSTGTNAHYSHAEGYKTTTQAPASHTEGDNTVANNASEHAEGRYNKSNMASETFGNAGNTLHSVGIGNASGEIPGGNRKNAFEIMQNGDAYLLNVGGYDGKNITEANTIQDTISNKVDEAPEDGKQYVRQDGDWAEVVIPEVPVEDVKVNGQSVVTNKVAEVQVPTKTSGLTNDGADGVRPFINESDADALIVASMIGHNSDGNAHSDIRQAVQSVRDDIPTKTSDLMNDGADGTLPFITDASITSAITTHNQDDYAHQDIRSAIPVNVSQLNNDLMFATYTEAQTLAQQEVATHNEDTYSHYDIRESIPHSTSDLFNDGDSGNPFVTLTEIDLQIGYHNENSSAHNDIRTSIPTDTTDLTNGAGFVTHDAITLEVYGEHDLSTNAHQNIISDLQPKTDSSLSTVDKTVVGAINEVNSIAKGANQALSYGNYSTMITAFNALAKDTYNIGQNVMIVTVEVPDLWISAIESTSVPYTYVDDATFVNALVTSGYVLAGYYKLSMLETQKVDLTNYYTKSQTYSKTETDTALGGKVNVTDYGKNYQAGILAPLADYALTAWGNGYFHPSTKTMEQYNSLSNEGFIGKGTLENIGDDYVSRHKGNLVTDTDYATASKGGVVKVDGAFGGILLGGGTHSGELIGVIRTYDQYAQGDRLAVLSKGTLENLLDADYVSRGGKVGFTDIATESKTGVILDNHYYGYAVAPNLGNLYAVILSFSDYTSRSNNIFIGKGTLENLLDAQYIQRGAITHTATLTVAGWSNEQQTVSVADVTASNLVEISPDALTLKEYSECGVYCSTQANGTLTFKCDSIPTTAITVNVVVWR